VFSFGPADARSSESEMFFTCGGVTICLAWSSIKLVHKYSMI
jgi:hypothetical protein